MDLSSKINLWCRTDNSLSKDICKAFWIIDTITGLTLLTISLIVLYVKVI